MFRKLTQPRVVFLFVVVATVAVFSVAELGRVSEAGSHRKLGTSRKAHFVPTSELVPHGWTWGLQRNTGVGVNEAKAPGAPSAVTTLFFAGVEQFTLGSGQIDLFNVTLGGNTAGSDTFAAASPATLATTTSTNEGKPDINNPVDLRFDKSGDLLIANGGTSNADPGSFACVPAGAVTTGANSSTTITQTGTNPTAFGYLAYDARDGSAAIANNSVTSAKQLFEYLLSGSYSAAPAPRNLLAPGFGGTAVTEVPSLAAGTYAVALQTGAEEDPGHGGTVGTNKVALFAPTGSETDISDDTSFSVDEPYSLAFDGQNNQLVISNFSTWHRLLSFYNLAATPPTLVKTVNTTFRNTYTAASPDGHVAVAWVKPFGYMQVQIYDNTAARNPVFGPIPYNGTTTSCGSTYNYGNGSAIVTSLRWLSNTKLLVGVESNNSGTPTAKNGFYIYDITNSEVPAGFDDVTCSAFTAAPINTGFVHIGLHPFAAAVRSGSFTFADPAGSCSGNTPCFTTINAAIAAASAGGVVNIFGGTYNEAVALNNANVTVNVDANATVNSFTLTAGTLNAGGGFCAQANGPTLTLANGNWTNNGGTFNPGGGTVVMGGSSAQTIGGSSPTTFNSLTLNNANGVTMADNETVGGTLTLTSGVLATAANTLTLNGGVTTTSGSINGTTGTVNYNQGSNAQSVAPGTYGNLTFSNFTKVLPNGGTVKIAGTFTTGAAGGHTVTGSTVEFNGASAQTLPSTFTTYNNLNLNNAAGTTGFSGLTVQGLMHVVNGTFTSDNATFNNVQIDTTLAGTNTKTINVSGAWTNNGTFTANGSTVNFNGGGAQTLGGTNATTFGNLTIANAAGVSLGNSETVSNALTLTSGSLAVGSNTLTLNGAVSGGGSLTSNANGTVNYNQSSNGQNVAPGTYGNVTFSNFTKTLPNGGTVKIAGTFTTGAGGGHTITGSTVEYNGTSAQTLPSGFTTYNNLTLNNATGTTGFSGLTAQGLVDVAKGTITSDNATFNGVQIDAAGTLAGVNATAINVGGTWTNNGTFTPNGDTVNFNGASGQTIGGTTAPSFSGLTINDALGVTVPTNMSVGGTLTLTNGALGIGTTTLTLNGPVSFTGGTISSTPTGTVSYNKGSNGQTVAPGTYGNLTFSDFTKTLASSGIIKIAGTFTTGATGGHTVTGSTVEFNGSSAQALPAGLNTYNNLTINNASGVTLSTNTSIGGLLNLLNGNLTTGANTLALLGGATTSRTSGQVIGVIQKTFAAGLLAEPGLVEETSGPDVQQVGPTPFVFPVGTAAGYFPVTVTPTSTSNGSLTVQTFDGNPPPTSAGNTLQRYWTMSSTGSMQADVKFSFGATATPGTVANYRELRVVPGNQIQSFPNGAPCPGAGSPCFDNTAKTIFVAGVTAFNANWTAGEPLGTTAAHVAVSGRVVSAEGIAIRGVRVTLDDGTGKPMTVTTNAFGYYHFDAVQSGGTYVLNANGRGYTFSPRVVAVTDQLADLDLVALP